jgi:hypothetical protein
MKGCAYTPHVSAALYDIAVTKQQQESALAAKQAEAAADKARKAETAESNAQLVRAMIARGDSEGIRRMMAPMVIAAANIIVAPDKAFTAKGPALAALSQLCADAVAAASGPCSVANLLS